MKNPTHHNGEENGDGSRSASPRLAVAGMVAGTTVLGTMMLIGPFVVPALRSARGSKGGPLLPYMATPKEKVKEALLFLARKKKRPAASGGGVFVDLGSGDGEAVYQALQVQEGDYSYQQAIGVEMNFTLYALSQFRRRFFWSRDERRRSQFVWGDMFAYDVSHADTIMVFGVQPLMHRISRKLEVECLGREDNAAIHVLSYRFGLPVVDAQDETLSEKPPDDDLNQNDQLLRANLVYDKDEMRIYECRQ